MGKVAITFKVMPESIETNIQKLREALGKKIEIQDYHIDEVAFGLKVLRILVLRDDAATNELEEIIRSVEGVSEVEVESSTLI